jgi:glutamate-1-semialdehyde 2,1-aminomutase
MPNHPMIAGIRRDVLQRVHDQETATYVSSRPKTLAALKAGADAFLDQVPMHWMKDWPQPFPMLVAKAKGATLTDLDNHIVSDFCLGDTGSMFGHSPPAIAKAIREQSGRGLTYMLPNQAALEAGQLLIDIFGDFHWQIATTATDANRFAIRVARAITNRPKILVFNGCYHGTVDEAMVTIDGDKTITRPGLLGQFADLSKSAVCVEFNDLSAVEQALKTGEIAAILMEPVMTNSCMVLPAPDFHQSLRKLASQHGTLLIIDETHTISTGYGGYTRLYSLQPDIFVLGKCVAGGMPTAVWGLSPETANRYQMVNANRPSGHSGMGTTLSANPMQFACLVANLSKVMTVKNYVKMEAGAKRLHNGLSKAIALHGLPWHVVRAGARVEFICANGPLQNGAEAAQSHQPELETTIHLSLLNRGCLIAPFHNMMLVSPVTSNRQIDSLIAAFDATLIDLLDNKHAE